MRRPVKPFVTEYKGSSRRGKDGRPEAEEVKAPAADGRAAGRPSGKTSARAASQRDGAGGESRTSLPPRGLFRNGGAEDEPINSYEAAMRAADALFSPKTKAAAETPSTGTGQTPPAAQAAAAEADAPPPGGQSETTGRVLRALDEPEPPAPEPVDEPPPPRRGRKPGSLNKPKVPGEKQEKSRRTAARKASQAPDEAPPTAPVEPEEAFPADTMGDVDQVAPLRHASEDIEVHETACDPAAGDLAGGNPTARSPAAMPGAGRQWERFSWVRTKLGPGEKWKRRLPKVAW